MKLRLNLSHPGAAWRNIGVAVATTGIVTGAIDKTLALPGVAIIGAGLLLIFIGCVETEK